VSTCTYIYFSPRVKARLFGRFFFFVVARELRQHSKRRRGGKTSLSPLPLDDVSTRARERTVRQNFDANNVWTRERATRNERSDVLDARCDERERESPFVKFVGFRIGARESQRALPLSLSLFLSLSPFRRARLFVFSNIMRASSNIFLRARADLEIFFFCTARTDSSRKKKSTRTRTLTAATISSKAVSEDARTFCSCWRLSRFGSAC